MAFSSALPTLTAMRYLALIAVVMVAAGCGGWLEQHAPHRLRAGHARPGRLHDRDHEPVLADGARRPLGLPGDRRRGRRAEGRGDGHRPDEDDRRHRGAGRPRRRLGGRRGDRGHVRLVRAGRRREHLVPRRGHEGVRERQGDDDRRLVGARRRRRPGGRHRPGEPEPGLEYRQEYYAGEAEDAATVLLTRRVGGGARGRLPRRAHDEGLHAARSPRSSSTSSTRRASARCSRWPSPAAPTARSWSAAVSRS